MDTYKAYSRKARKKDCKQLAKVMRESDIKEVMASHRHTPYEALVNAYTLSDSCYSWVYKGNVIAMCGVSPVDNQVGSPWLLGSDELVRTPRLTYSLLRESMKWIKRHQNKYPMLVNYVHAENEPSLKWLKHLGFTFIRKVEFSKEPFYEFVRIK
jgi:N-acetylglutamate synthase-like GNAT family acetyltransferase